jgi:hypothetical protein
MIGRLTAVIDGQRPPGVYRWLSRAHPNALHRELAAARWTLHPIDGQAVVDAATLFDECAEALAFPAWFGRNWDALADCLGDLSWLSGRGHVLLWDQYDVLARHDPKAWRLAYQVFEDATRARPRYGAAPFYVLLRGAGPTDHPDRDAPIPVL